MAPAAGKSFPKLDWSFIVNEAHTDCGDLLGVVFLPAFQRSRSSCVFVLHDLFKTD